MAPQLPQPQRALWASGSPWEGQRLVNLCLQGTASQFYQLTTNHSQTPSSKAPAAFPSPQSDLGGWGQVTRSVTEGLAVALGSLEAHFLGPKWEFAPLSLFSPCLQINLL